MDVLGKILVIILFIILMWLALGLYAKYLEDKRWG